MKASQLLKGKRAVHKVRFPICNFRCPILPDLPELAEQREIDRAAWRESHSGEEPREDEVEVGLMALSGLENGEILRNARAFAADRGVEDPREGDPIYGLGIMVHTLAVACVDPDNQDELFFDGGVEQILESEHLGRDGIIYLFEQQEQWQDLVSPQAHRIDALAFEQMVSELAGPDSYGFFCQLRPGLRWSCMHSMAALCLTLLSGSSQPTSGSESDTRSRPSRPSKTRSSGDKPRTRKRKRGA
jgi:hypothetical protein